jgi:hypothetical protein
VIEYLVLACGQGMAEAKESLRVSQRRQYYPNLALWKFEGKGNLAEGKLPSEVI